jgi:hypothetical protein
MVTGESQDAGKDGEPSVESRHFISSLDLSARKTLDSSIRHWTVETAHDILDMSHGEDKSRIGRGNAPAPFLPGQEDRAWPGEALGAERAKNHPCVHHEAQEGLPQVPVRRPDEKAIRVSRRSRSGQGNVVTRRNAIVMPKMAQKYAWYDKF